MLERVPIVALLHIDNVMGQILILPWRRPQGPEPEGHWLRQSPHVPRAQRPGFGDRNLKATNSVVVMESDTSLSASNEC